MKKRILIVEDEKIISEDLKLYIINFGYEVVEIAATCDEAIRMAKDFIPDLVLMDIKLEGNCTGLDAAKEIYQKLHIPIIFITAYSDDEFLEKATESVPYGYLIKPIDENRLYATLKMTFHNIEKDKRITEDLSSRIEKSRKIKKQNVLNEILKAIKEKIFLKNVNP